MTVLVSSALSRLIDSLLDLPGALAVRQHAPVERAQHVVGDARQLVRRQRPRSAPAARSSGGRARPRPAATRACRRCRAHTGGGASVRTSVSGRRRNSRARHSQSVARRPPGSRVPDGAAGGVSTRRSRASCERARLADRATTRCASTAVRVRGVPRMRRCALPRSGRAAWPTRRVHVRRAAREATASRRSMSTRSAPAQDPRKPARVRTAPCRRAAQPREERAMPAPSAPCSRAGAASTNAVARMRTSSALVGALVQRRDLLDPARRSRCSRSMICSGDQWKW